MSIENYYQLLGVERSATKSDINDAYSEHVAQVHPDQSSASDAEYWMIQLNKARDTLLERSSRENYDRFLDRFGPKQGHDEFLKWEKNGRIPPEQWESQVTDESNTHDLAEADRHRERNNSKNKKSSSVLGQYVIVGVFAIFVIYLILLSTGDYEIPGDPRIVVTLLVGIWAFSRYIK